MRLWPLKVSTTSVREAWRRVSGTGQPPLQTALSVGLGLAIGVLPVMPFQTVLALGASFLFRLNRVTTWLGTLIWQPFTAPFIMYAEVRMGRWFLAAPSSVGTGSAPSLWDQWGWPLVLGSGLMALAAMAIGTGVTYALLKARSRQTPAPPVSQGGGE